MLSHWLLDWITHRPDMPLYPGGTRFGLGLWNSIAGTMTAELAMFAAGFFLYLRATVPRDRIGTYAFLSYSLLLLAVYISNPFTGPPDSVHELISTGIIAECLLIPWAWWFDRHREPRPS